MTAVYQKLVRQEPVKHHPFCATVMRRGPCSCRAEERSKLVQGARKKGDNK